ncbi:probable alcohol acetyltransferase [[Candida] railenensis]|uniref:Probable alcohol acetyltransferase n=1 Tax=[Candida] railenensis TaxID=45579 RepID=A0A9P0W1N2_9ASCO|nr:probable alcohol acetyltransferase [[Candida] railenensis]
MLRLARRYATCNLPTIPKVPLVSEKFTAKNFTPTDKRTVLFLHGFLGSKKNYRTIGKTISRATGIDVIGLDLRNHGHSKHALPFDYQSLAKDVEEFIRHEQLSDLVIIGHSMGAKTGMYVALQNPDLVSSLVVVDNTPDFTPLDDSFRDKLKALYEIEQLKIPTDTKQKDISSKVDEVFDKYGMTSIMRTFLLSNLDKSHKYVRFINPNYCFLSNKVIDILSEWPTEDLEGKRYDGPVLVVRSTQSGFIPSLEPFTKYFQNIKLVDFDASHYIVTEKGKEFLEEILQHLNSNKSIEPK